MTQTIDPIKPKAAAEHLEWVLQQYPKSEHVQALLRAFTPLIEDAKAGRVDQTIDSGDVPGAHNFAEGVYPYEDPSVEEAYTSFRTELKGELTEQDTRIHARIAAMQERIRSETSA